MYIKKPKISRWTQIKRFLRISRLLLWTLWTMYRERRRLLRGRAQGDLSIEPRVEILVDVLTEFRSASLELGGLMIKLGQFLSTRADILPEEALHVLASLQDEVPPESLEHITYAIESELGQPLAAVFSSFTEECAAAASLGQVHKAVLASTGETVAVKVQRPNIDRIVQIDLSTLRFVVWIVSRFVDSRFFDLKLFYTEFRRVTLREIDYLTEAAQARRFREIFEDNLTVYIPRFYESYCHQRMLVMEWIDGIKINDYSKIDALGYNRLEIAKRTVQAYFFQIFSVGFFHADPHPGNIFIKVGSPLDEPVIAFVDFGMVGTLTGSMRQALRDVFVGVVTRDHRKLVQALVKLGFIGQGADILAIEEGLELLMEQYFGMTLGEIKNVEMEEVFRDVQALLYGQPFQIPAQFAFTGRAVSVLVGVSTGLAPEFDFIEVATPYARHLMGWDKQNINQTLQDMLRKSMDTLQVWAELPRSLQKIISRMEAGQFEVRLASPLARRGVRWLSGMEALRSGKISLAMVTLGCLVGALILMTVGQLGAGWFCLALTAVCAGGLLWHR